MKPLAGQPLPAHDEVAGAVVMGGPMNVDEVERFPALAAEREWLAEALRREMPVLGICLGAQLLARALGAEVRPGEGKEIGFAPVEVTDPADPILGALAPSANVLHWHGDVFDLPDGARPLASSALTEHQAFRLGNAWGVLFHPEADLALVEAWLAVPEMIDEAVEVLGDGGAAALPAQASEVEADRCQNIAYIDKGNDPPDFAGFPFPNQRQTRSFPPADPLVFFAGEQKDIFAVVSRTWSWRHKTNHNCSPQESNGKPVDTALLPSDPLPPLFESYPGCLISHDYCWKQPISPEVPSHPRPVQSTERRPRFGSGSSFPYLAVR